MLPVLRGDTNKLRDYVFGSHTGNDNGGPGIANHCPARTIRNNRFRYILNLSPDTLFTTHITGTQSGIHYLPFWNSWIEKSKTDKNAKWICDAYMKRPQEELYDLENDPFEMENLAENPKYNDVLGSLKNQLHNWCVAQGDTVALVCF